MSAAVPPVSRGRLRGSVLRTLMSVALLVAIFVFAFPKVADLGEVHAPARAMTWLEIATLAVGAAWNLVTYRFVMMLVLPGRNMRHAMLANMTGGAISNTVPAGGAIAVGMTCAMYASWGFSSSQIGLSVWSPACGTTSSSSGCRSSPWRCSPSAGRPVPGSSRPLSATPVGR